MESKPTFFTGFTHGANSIWAARAEAADHPIHITRLRRLPCTPYKNEITHPIRTCHLRDAIPWLAMAGETRHQISPRGAFFRLEWFTVKDADAVVAIGFLLGGIMCGTTGWTCQTFIEKSGSGEKLYFFDQHSGSWLRYVSYRKWEVRDPPPALSSMGKVALIGSRVVNERGRKAILSCTF
jgi:hypothetical protein